MVRQSPHNPQRWFFDFDAAAAAAGGGGGASVLLYHQGLASIDAVHKNTRLPRRSTGRLLAEGLKQAGLPRPMILEAYNVEKSTHAALATGSAGAGTLLGNMLEDTATALGGTIVRWEPILDVGCYHLRLHVAYP